MDDRSADPAPPGASAPTDRVGSLSARLSEALTAVGIAVRRREAEIELIDRTLAASSDAQSAAARQAADRMARLRGEHADELQLMQRARRALEDASSVAGELSLELDTRRGESEEAVREADALRRSLESSEIELGELRARVVDQDGKAAALEEDLEQARRALAAREAELEQVWRELDVKTREAQELARLMGAFTPGEELPREPDAAEEPPSTAPSDGSEGDSDGDSGANGAVDVAPAESDGPDTDDASADEPPAPPDETELAAVTDDVGEGAPLPRFTEAPDLDLSVGVVHDIMDEMGDVEAVPPPASAAAGGDADGADSDDDDDALVLEETVDAEVAAAPPEPDDDDDAVPDPTVDISVDDWGAAVEDEPAVALPGPSAPAAARADIDGELQAYLSDGDDVAGDDERLAASGGAFSPDALFKATSGISEFRCATPEEVRLAGALQLQSWRPSELAQLLGIEVTLVREKLEGYHERGLVEVVGA